MPKSNRGQKFILCIIDEVTNYLITVPLYQSKLEEVGEALIEHVIIDICELVGKVQPIAVRSLKLSSSEPG